MGMRYYNLTKQNEMSKHNNLNHPIVKKEEEEIKEIKNNDEWGDEKMMMGMKTKSDSKNPEMLLKRAINMFAIGQMFHSNASLESHKMGLQGFKRLHRYYARKDIEAKMKLEHYAIDMFGMTIKPDWESFSELKDIKTVKEMLDCYLEHEMNKYAELAEVANELTVNEFLNESHMIREELECVAREIIKCRRYIQDYENSAWSWHHIRYIDNMLHDKFKKKEHEEFSYKD